MNFYKEINNKINNLRTLNFLVKYFLILSVKKNTNNNNYLNILKKNLFLFSEFWKCIEFSNTCNITSA